MTTESETSFRSAVADRHALGEAVNARSARGRAREAGNCLRYALTWRTRLLDPSRRRPTRDFIQPALFDRDHGAERSVTEPS